MKYLIKFCLLFLVGNLCHAQNSTSNIEGYVYETNNRGYLSKVRITLINEDDGGVEATTVTDKDGHFELSTDHHHSGYIVKAEHKLFFAKKIKVSPPEDGKKNSFVKFELERRPGYIFDVTLAESRPNENVVDAIQGAKIEIYNNTSKKEVLVIDTLASPNFNFTFQQGNHYTVMVRKRGYLTKRMEAYINIDGCILCFEGVSEVTDVMTQSNELGTFLANVELDRIALNTTFELKNIYYDYDQSYIREDASKELDKVVTVLKDNPGISVELGSHTDSRGKDTYNMQLSDRRAAAAVAYLVENGIDPNKLSSRGYGETQLVNRCRNGVECTEKEHQENRRTQLKITGIEKINPLDQKSLKQIIEEDLILQNLDNTQLQIKPGEDLPEEIKRDIEKLNGGGLY